MSNITTESQRIQENIERKAVYNARIKEILDRVTGWHDGPEDKYNVIARLVELARNGEYKEKPEDACDYITEVIMVVQEEWED